MENETMKNWKEKAKIWFKDRDNVILFGILVFALAIRLYYFFMTKSQPLWWDEADYMAYAKNLAGYSTHWIVTGQHNSLFPFCAALVFMLGFSEAIVRFILEFIPSIVIVYLTYEICFLVYKQKKIALISCFLMAVFWELLFNSFRLHVEGPGLLLGFLAMYTFWKGYENKEKMFGFVDPKWAILLTVVLSVMTYAFRRGYFVFGLFFLVYMLVTKKFKDLIKDKHNWIALFIGVLLIFAVESMVFTEPITKIGAMYYGKAPINFEPFKVFGAYFNNIAHPGQSILLYLFVIGIIAMLARTFLVIDKIREQNETHLKGDVFFLVTIIVVLLYFMFYQKGAFGEPRWYYPLLLGSLVGVSRGIILITDFVRKYSKYISIALLLFLVGFGGYYEFTHANMIIKEKVSSFQGIKDAGLFIKGISAQEDVIISVPMPQPAYYAERKVLSPHDFLNLSSDKGSSDVTFEQFMQQLRGELKVRFLVVTFSEPNHPSWMRKDKFGRTQTGQTVYAGWEIPFMNTTVDFVSGKQDIKKEMKYGNITFTLLNIKEDAFIYGITHN